MNAGRIVGSAGKAHRALLVDDDEFMLAVIRDMLRDLGVVQVATAANGSAALVVYDRATPRPNLIVCDLNMPGMDGFQLMEELSNREFAGGIVLVSGMDSSVRNSAAMMGKFHHLNILASLGKPVGKADLGVAVAKLS